MRDTLALLISLLLLVVSLTGGGFFFGRKYEEWQVKRQLPTVMDNLCRECNDLGIKEGYQKGLKMCDDLMNTPEDGRY